MSFDPSPAADALIAARRDRRVAGPLPADIAPRDEAQAALVQLAVASRLGVLPVGGFKIGATGRRMQEYLDLDHPCAGFMASADLHRSGIALPFAAFRNVAVECELAVRLAMDLPPGPCQPEEARGAVGELFAAIEIVENRYGKPPIGDLKAVGTPTMIADQVYHAAAVLGEPASDWRELDLLAIEGRALIDGVLHNSGRGAELLGDPMRALAWLAGSEVAAAFSGLRAGQVVMLGSVTPPVWPEGPCHVTMDFDGLAKVELTFS
jgi:2-keto-4-pentenoate hydratase